MRNLVIVIVVMLCASSQALAQVTRVSERLGGDSTIFTIEVPPNHELRIGKSLTVKLHVTFAEKWHVYSSHVKPSYAGVSPLTLGLAEGSASNFQLLKVTEAGRVTSSFDTNFNQRVIAHYEPFDIVVKLRARKSFSTRVPLRFIVNFQACSESLCMPPRAFEIPMRFLGQKAVFVRPAGARSHVERPN